LKKPKTKKTEPNPNKKTRKKPSQTGKNRVKLVFVQKNRTEIDWFEPVSILKKKISI
jgi:hypothetical protein